ncbi:MAG TPA: type I phosphomannose isomerase catalytic subunit, partial [Thermomicrobiales bacterium]|nr:type I phosphomannose isomerase catalytic subunit [Thermomicrobiales bacterium]
MERFGPLSLQPRLDVKPWGGRLLAQFGLPLPSDALIGEAVITAPEAVVGDGPLAGRTLGEIVAADPATASGPLGLAATGGRPRFPLLIKLIDATENLSIQVHPPDDMAVQEDDGLGKTEAWHVLTAQPGSALYLGLRPGVGQAEFAAAASAGQPTASLMRRLDACPNTTYLIPAGTVHALGAGVVIYEVQQPSTITYRLDDWGRVDAAG